jgi:hypothetical protein
MNEVKVRLQYAQGTVDSHSCTWHLDYHIIDTEHAEDEHRALQAHFVAR